MAAQETKEKESKAPESPREPETAGQAKIVWDHANMRSAYANVFNIAPGREEFVIFFGMNQAWDAGQNELRVQLSDRIVMSPFAAKRLAMALNGVIAEHEKRFGIIDIEARRA